MRKKLMSCMLVLLLVIAVVLPEVKAKGLADSGWIGTRCAYTLYLRNADKSYLYGILYLDQSGTGNYRYPRAKFTPQAKRQVQIYAGCSEDDYTTWKSDYSIDEKLLKHGYPVYYTDKNYGRVYIIR